jgi:hypothetical protein
MAIRSDIYFQQKAPDLVGGFARGQQMARARRQDERLAEEDARKQKLMGIYKTGIVEGPEGEKTLDLNLVQKNLMGAGFAPEALKLRDSLQNQERLDQQAAFEREKFQSTQDYRNKQLELARQKQKQKGSMQFSPGQKKIDTEFAKEYNEWTSGGADVAKNEIDKLQNVVDRLEGGEVTTGGLTGLFPDRMTSDEVLSARSDVQSTVMNSLRAILGAQFTEKEGERIIKNTWNEADSTKNNVARLNRLIKDLTNKYRAKEQKSMFYEDQGGTLYGYKPTGIKKQMEAQFNERKKKKRTPGYGVEEAYATPMKTFKTEEIDWAD